MNGKQEKQPSGRILTYQGNTLGSVPMLGRKILGHKEADLSQHCIVVVGDFNGPFLPIERSFKPQPTHQNRLYDIMNWIRQAFIDCYTPKLHNTHFSWPPNGTFFKIHHFS